MFVLTVTESEGDVGAVRETPHDEGTCIQQLQRFIRSIREQLVHLNSDYECATGVVYPAYLSQFLTHEAFLDVRDVLLKQMAL